MSNRKSIFHVLTLVLIAAILLTGCGGGSSAPQAEVSVRLKWTPQVQFSGIYVADKEGYYAQENLKVTVDPVDFEQMNAIDKILEGKNTFGIASADEVISARAKGQPVKAIAVIFRISPLVLMSIDNVKISTPQDLVGKKVGVHGGQAYTVYSAMLSRAEIDPASIDYSQATEFDVLKCLQTVDVCTAYSTDGIISAEMQGHEVSSMFFNDYGVPFYADVIVASDDLIAKDPALVERFLRATLRGWQTAIENPQKGVDDTIAFAPDLNADFQLRSMKATIPLVNAGGLPVGVMEPESWKTMYDILLEQKVIAPFDVTTAYTSQFVDKLTGK